LIFSAKMWLIKFVSRKEVGDLGGSYSYSGYSWEYGIDAYRIIYSFTCVSAPNDLVGLSEF
jgi:hypothetical protein